MRRLIRILATGVAALGFVVAVATPAAAHDGVAASTPSDGEVLTSAPEEFSLTATDTLLAVGNDEVFGLWARDDSGDFYGDECTSVAGATMTAPAVLGEPGAYTLVAAFVSSDGHPTTAEIPFEWAPAGEYTAAEGTAEPTRCGVPTASDEPSAAPASPDSTLLWVLIAVAAVVLAVVVTIAVARPRRTAADRG